MSVAEATADIYEGDPGDECELRQDWDRLEIIRRGLARRIEDIVRKCVQENGLDFMALDGFGMDCAETGRRPSSFLLSYDSNDYIGIAVDVNLWEA